MIEPDNLRYRNLALSNEAGAIPALGFGTLKPSSTWSSPCRVPHQAAPRVTLHEEAWRGQRRTAPRQRPHPPLEDI